MAVLSLYHPMNSPTSNSSHANGRRHWISRIIVGFVVLAFGTAATVIYCDVQTSLTAERNLHAMLDAIGACQRFVEQNNGTWPRSPSDIGSLHSDNREWIPRDAVHIDFNANASDLAKQDWQTFTGITVDDPVYLAYERRLDALIDVLQRYYPSE